jgi:DNA anti-recombination protein RmuC
MRTTLVFLVSVLLAACSDGTTGRQARLQRASQGLCDAQVQAFHSNVRRAADAFDRDTHAFLHELAADLQEIDRQLAARLLEAKQRVENAFLDPTRADPQQVAQLLAELQRALREGAEVAGLPTPLCREGAT